MRMFMCFGGSAAVVDDDDVAAAAVAARHQGERTRSLSFRGKFLLPGSSGRKDKTSTKEPSPVASPPAEARKHLVDADDAYSLLLTRASTAAASVTSSALLSSAASLEHSSSTYSASSRSATASASSSVSSSPSVSGLLSPPPAAKRQASERPTKTCPAAGAAAVVLCLLMVVFWGRVGATVITSTALYLFPRRWPARSVHQEDGVGSSLECGAEEVTPQRKVVRE